MYENQLSVEIDGTISKPATVTCGVQQGSIIGFLLFLIYRYINDIPSAVHCKVLLYPNDSALIVSDNNAQQIQDRLSSELESVREWLTDNKYLHLGK